MFIRLATGEEGVGRMRKDLFSGWREPIFYFEMCSFESPFYINGTALFIFDRVRIKILS